MQFSEFYKQYLFHEAISLKNSKKRFFSRKHSGAYKLEKLNHLFGNKDRLIYPINISSTELITKENPLVLKISEKLYSKFEMTIRTRQDYIQGVAYKIMDNDKKQPYKIGKLLLKLANSGDEEAKSLFESFRDDPERNAKNTNKFFVVISRHPYDIAGMSSDRNWSSCMNLGFKALEYKEKGKQDMGINARYVAKDIELGSIIAYLVADEDRHPNGKLALRRPISRILMRPHGNLDSETDTNYMYSQGRMYGVSNTSFDEFVNDWLLRKVNSDNAGTSYGLLSGLYDDGDRAVGFKKGERKSNIISKAFRNVMNDSFIDRKYHQFFTINEIYGYRDGDGFEIQIRYPLPEDVKVHEFHYTYNDVKPQFVKDIIKSSSIGLINYNGSSHYQVQSVTNETPNAIVVEYAYYGGNMEYGDNEKYEMSDREKIEAWEETMTHMLKLDNFDYRNARNKIFNILSKFNLTEETEKEEQILKDEFQSKITPYIKEKLESIRQNYEHAFELVDKIQQVANNAPNPEIAIYEYLLNNRHDESFLREFKNDIVSVTLNLRNASPNNNYSSKYHFVPVHNKWLEFVNEYIGENHLVENFYNKADSLRAVQFMIKFKQLDYVKMTTEFSNKYGRDALENLQRWIQNLSSESYYAREMKPLFN